MKTCLVVDDSSVIRKVARRILEGLEFQIVEAEDGEKALEACKSQLPDAVVLDGNMPVMDGYDFLRNLRRMPGGDRPKVVFCTTENDVAHIASRICALPTKPPSHPLANAALLTTTRYGACEETANSGTRTPNHRSPATTPIVPALSPTPLARKKLNAYGKTVARIGTDRNRTPLPRGSSARTPNASETATTPAMLLKARLVFSHGRCDRTSVPLTI